MKIAEKKVRKTIDVLKSHSIGYLGKIENILYTECGYKENDIPPAEGWKQYASGQRLSGSDKHFWFKLTFHIPKMDEGKYAVLSTSSGYEGQRDTINPQGMVFIDGKIKQALDTNHTQVRLEDDRNYELYIYFYVGSVEETFEYKMWLSSVDEIVHQLYYDISVPFSACQNVYIENSYEYAMTMKSLSIACDMLELNYPYTEEYYSSVIRAKKYLKDEYYGKICGNNPVTVNCIGHTHIDVAWLWTLAQTKEKVQRSFSTVLELMSCYPEYRFMMTQPQLFKYLSKVDPEMYDKIKELVADGRWELEGAMWLEADCNLISGESMVRQILHGKRFLKKEFNIESKVLWLPDVFGYSAAMPQILKKSGITHFVTSKISWNDTNTMPYDTFMWQGIDGSEIITDFITTQDYKRGGEFKNATTYVGKITPSMVAGCWNRYQQKAYNDRVMLIYGWGDGGGGPTEDMLEQQRRLAYGLPGIPKTKMSSLADHLEYTEKKFAKSCEEIGVTPKWTGELYLEFHRGTYTSMAKNKRFNRKGEMLMQSLESISAINAAILKSRYEKEEFYGLWDILLLNQFHDILPGSSIRQVYEDSHKQYEEFFCSAGRLLDNNLALLARNVSAENGVLVYNPLGFERSDIICVNGECFESGLIPAYGWKVITPDNKTEKVKISARTVENDFFVLEIDNAGRIKRLYDKRNEREVLKCGMFANEFRVYEDMPLEYENWELAEYYDSKQTVLSDDACISEIHDGCRCGFRISRKYHNSELTQELYLYNGIERIDVLNKIEWHEKKQLVKIAFPFDIHTDKAVYDIQFGNVERNTCSNTGWDKAKFEVCGHKWADLSEQNYGVSLLNDCKYGFSTRNNILMMTVLKCGTYPNEVADQGLHEFSYSIYPHKGNFASGGTVRAAYSFNQPLKVVEVSGRAGKVPTEYGFVKCGNENIIIETLKQCEDNDDYILRLYDAFNCRTDAVLEFALSIDNIELCDLMENSTEKLEFKGNSVKVNVNNYEIVTLKVSFKK